MPSIITFRSSSSAMGEVSTVLADEGPLCGGE